MGRGRKKKNEAFVISPSLEDLDMASLPMVRCAQCAGQGENCPICNGAGKIDVLLAESLMWKTEDSEDWYNAIDAIDHSPSELLHEDDDFSTIASVTRQSDERYHWQVYEDNTTGDTVVAEGVAESIEEAKSNVQETAYSLKCPTCARFMSASGGHQCPDSSPTVDEVNTRIENIRALTEEFNAAGGGGYGRDISDISDHYMNIREESIRALDSLNAEGSNLSESQWSDLRKELGKANEDALMNIEADNLARLAQLNGIRHPGLLSEGSTRFALNPAYLERDKETGYLSSSAKQEKVLLCAANRYQDLLDGGEYNGMNLADYKVRKAEIDNDPSGYSDFDDGYQTDYGLFEDDEILADFPEDFGDEDFAYDYSDVHYGSDNE